MFECLSLFTGVNKPCWNIPWHQSPNAQIQPRYCLIYVTLVFIMAGTLCATLYLHFFFLFVFAKLTSKDGLGRCTIAVYRVIWKQIKTWLKFAQGQFSVMYTLHLLEQIFCWRTTMWWCHVIFYLKCHSFSCTDVNSETSLISVKHLYNHISKPSVCINI